MRIHQNRRYSKRSLAVALLMCCGAAAGYATLRVQAAQSNNHTASLKPASEKVAAKKPAKGKVSTKKSARNTRNRVRAQMAPTSGRISEIQSALATQGTYHGEVNGKWDAATVEAMRQFQSAHG